MAVIKVISLIQDFANCVRGAKQALRSTWERGSELTQRL